MPCFFPRRRSSLPWRPSSYMMVSASHGNDDRLHLNDDRLHGYKGLNPFSNIQSRHQSFLLQTNLRRLSFSKMQAFIPFLYLSKQYIFISCRSHISVYQQNRKNNIKILNWNILIFWSKEKKQETGVIVQNLLHQITIWFIIFLIPFLAIHYRIGNDNLSFLDLYKFLFD